MVSARIDLGHGLALAHHHDPVGDREGLFELVADEHDALAGGLELADDLEEVVDLLWCQYRGGLVEHQEACVAGEDLDDLDALLDADREILDDGGRVEVEAVALRRVRAPTVRRLVRLIPPKELVGSMPRITFSATVNTGTSMKC